MIPPALWVLVPLKNLGRAKERLSGALAALERRELVEAMARDVIEALQAVPVASRRIVLVSDDADVAALAAEYGVTLFRPGPAAPPPDVPAPADGAAARRMSAAGRPARTRAAIVSSSGAMCAKKRR